LTLKSKIQSLLRNPFILKDLLQGKSRIEIRTHVRKANEQRSAKSAEKEVLSFIANLKQHSPYFADSNDNLKLNKLCYIEDWGNKEIKNMITEFRNVNSSSYADKKDWEMTSNIVNRRKEGFIHRKDWEWEEKKFCFTWLTSFIVYSQLTSMMGKAGKVLPHQIFPKTQRNMHPFHTEKMP